MPPYSIPLPDTYSGYPKFLIRNVREGDLLGIEEAIAKCTSLPAKSYGLEGRGVIEVGAYADIAVIDWDGMRIVGKPEESRNYPEGVRYVLVNGSMVVDDGVHTGERPGQILRRER